MMKPLYRFLILGAIAALIAGCKEPAQTELNGGSGSNGPGYLYAGTYGDGVFRSEDKGITWMWANSGLTCDTLSAFASDSAYLFAGTFGGGVFRSSDNGQSWIQVNNGLSNHDIGSLFASGSSLFAGVSSFGGTGGIFRSTDEGETWSLTEFTGSDVGTIGGLGQFLFAATDNSVGVYRSSDNGTSWILMNNILSEDVIYLLSAVGSTLFAGTQNGLFRSQDSGSSWQSANLQQSIVSIIGNGNNLLAGSGEGLFRSTDNGIEWKQTSFPADGQVDMFVSEWGRIFAGTSDQGVFVSIDNGSYWEPANKEIENEQVNAIAIH
jgi:ligand-binding sensor domain-containing protein